MEYGETDLKSFLSQHQDKGSSIDMNSVRLLWQQMLESVNTIHQASIIHSDLKPANFLFVRGCLKLIDFGIARSMGPESTSVLRDSQVGTLNYISPEALLDEGNGIRVSLSGCVERRLHRRVPDGAALGDDAPLAAEQVPPRACVFQPPATSLVAPRADGLQAAGGGSARRFSA